MTARLVHHLHDDRLFDCYVATRGGDSLDPPAAEHLDDCPACAERYADLIAFMDSLRAQGEAEADAVFTPERLRAQQQQIARRVEQVGRPARVLSFPARVVRRTMTASASRTAPRWAAAAVAAGLFVGVALGSYEYGVHRRQANVPSMTAVATDGSSQPSIAADDAFLTDLELALDRPHTRELVAFDALTPHVREVRDTK